MKVYLAGKCNGRKWELAEALTRAYGKHEFIASDDRVHSENHGFSWHEQFGGNNLSYEVEKAIIVPLLSCDRLIAYLDSATAYGSIAEIAYAAGSGMDCTVFVDRNKEPQGDFADAYVVVTNLPNVTTVMVNSIAEAVFRLRFYFLCESPIELALAESMRRVFYFKECDGLHPQYPIGNYRLDFAFPTQKLAIECDGHNYHASKEQRGRDAERDRYLIKEGWLTLRFTGTQIHQDSYKCAREIKTILETLTIREMGNAAGT